MTAQQSGKVIITCAVTGAIHTPSMTPYLPITPDEITKEALAAKRAQGVLLGKPKGTIQTSMYDKDRERIVELLSLGLSVRKISLSHLGYGYPSSLHTYVTKRGLLTEAEKLRDLSGLS